MANPQRNPVRLPRPGRSGRTESPRRQPAPPRLRRGSASIAFPADAALLARPLKELRCIGSLMSTKLARANVLTTADLLGLCDTPPRRRALAEATDLSEDRLRRWAQVADLMRVEGVGDRMAERLIAHGYESTPELAEADADSLAEDLRARWPADREPPSPTVEQTRAWVTRARALV